MSNRALWLTLFLSLLLSGCGLAVLAVKGAQMLHVPLDSDENKPGPYVIADVQFRPNIEQGQLSFVEAHKYSVKGVVNFRSTADLRPVDFDKEDNRSGAGQMASTMGTVFFGTGVDYSGIVFTLRKIGLSVVPMPAGPFYLRYGSFLLRSFCRNSQSTRGADGTYGSSCSDFVQEQIKISRDIKIEVPADAEAVYIGRLVIDHNGTLATKVTVSDQFASAMEALRKQPIAGIDPKKVQKRLAIVLPKS